MVGTLVAFCLVLASPVSTLNVEERALHRTPAVTDGRPSPEDGVREVDPARVMRRTSLALGIRSIVQRWPTEGDGPVSDQARLEQATQASGLADGSGPYEAVEFAIRPFDDADAPSEADLRAAYDALSFHLPREVSGSEQATEAAARSLRDVALITALSPAGDDLSVDALGGAGVSLQQALLEGATAFLLDRARADLARAGLDVLLGEIEDSPLRDALPQTSELAGYGSGSADPRLYLASLQAALAADFDELPAFLTQRLSGSGIGGLEPQHWRLAYGALRLVDDVQRGTHPLLALSTFSETQLLEEGEASVDGDDLLQRRLFELNVLATVLYAGTVEVEGRPINARAVLGALDGRGFFAAFLADELKRDGQAENEEFSRDQTAARVVELLQTLDDVVRQLDELRDQYDQIRTANPEVASSQYAGYIAVTTRAVRQILQDGGYDEEAGLLSTVEDLISIREAVVQRDYPKAVALATPYLTRALGDRGAGVRSVVEQAGGLVVLVGDTPPGDANWEGALIAAEGLLSAADDAAGHALSYARMRRQGLRERIRDVPRELRTVRGVLLPLERSAESAVDAWEDVDAPIGGAREALRRARRAPGDERESEWLRLRGALQAVVAAIEETRTREVALVDSYRSALSDIALVSGSRDVQLEVSTWLAGELRAKGDPELVRLFTAVAAIAGSSTSEDVYDSLVLYSAPPGSFRDRRGSSNPKTSVAIGAYVGAVGGREWAEGADAGRFHGGAFLPVGVEVSRGVDLGAVRSIGMFLSPLNLGTFVDYSGNGSPEYTLAQAFSPSVNVTAGLWENVPLSIGIGASYVPEFRQPEGEVSNLSAWRVSTFATVDVPLWIWRPR